MHAKSRDRGFPEAAMRAAWGAAILLVAAPFLWVTIPPLVDAPGHLGQLAVQTAPAGSMLHRYFAFHWALRLNLGTDLLVQLLHPALGLQRAFWLVAASVPLLTALAVWLLARHANPGEAAAASWALPLAYSYPFLYGFLNYALGMSLALIGYAGWVALAPRPGLREPLYWLAIPLLLLCHAIGGGLLPLMIVCGAAGRCRLLRVRPPFLATDTDGWVRFLREVRPVLAGVIVLLMWMHAGAGRTGTPVVLGVTDKLNALVMALRDQDRWLDIASIAGLVLVPLAGAVLGARYDRASGLVLAAVGLLFLAMPAEFGGASFNDMRLVPPLLILALALQDWSAVAGRWRRIAAWSGFALFAVRLAVTGASFAAYDRAFAAERQALPHVARGARVLALVERHCRASRSWRMSRLDHLPSLVSVEREGWVNSHWDVPGIHLLTVRYRPAFDFYDDPSHYVWPASCTGVVPPAGPHQLRDTRRTLAETLPLLPLERVDYLWLIDARLPPGAWTSRLRLVWQGTGSALYRTRPAGAVTPPWA